MDGLDRVARADLRRTRAVLNRTRLQRIEPDPVPVSGPAALSLVDQLTRESWAVAGLDMPLYGRTDIPVRFVPRKSA